MQMITMDKGSQYPSSKTLVENHIASRVHAKDASLYSFDAAAQECAAHFMGWAETLSS